MTEAVDSVATSYRDWLTGSVSAENLGDGLIELTTPFLDRHNDHLQIYAEPSGPDMILLTDDGYIMAELKSSGVEARGTRREEVFNTILRGHGVSLEEGELRVEASAGNLGQKVHDLVQAMLSLDDMHVLAQDNIKRVFHDDVRSFLKRHSIRYVPNVKMSGKSGFDHVVDFVIPESKEAPMRALQALNSPRRDRVDSFLFAIDDIRRVRGEESEYYAVVNDSRKPVPPEVSAALRQYSVNIAPWSQIEMLTPALAA